MFFNLCEICTMVTIWVTGYTFSYGHLPAFYSNKEVFVESYHNFIAYD